VGENSALQEELLENDEWLSQLIRCPAAAAPTDTGMLNSFAVQIQDTDRHCHGNCASESAVAGVSDSVPLPVVHTAHHSSYG